MAAHSTLQKVLKTAPTPSRILASLHHTCFQQHSPNPSQSHPLNNPTTPFHENHTTKIASFLGPIKELSFTHFDSLPFSPIHPFGLCSNSILASGSISDLQNNDEGMWADSVKKKRKKKMNKHKYKKLRKRLRRKT